MQLAPGNKSYLIFVWRPERDQSTPRFGQTPGMRWGDYGYLQYLRNWEHNSHLEFFFFKPYFVIFKEIRIIRFQIFVLSTELTSVVFSYFDIKIRIFQTTVTKFRNGWKVCWSCFDAWARPTDVLRSYHFPLSILESTFANHKLC